MKKVRLGFLYTFIILIIGQKISSDCSDFRGVKILNLFLKFYKKHIIVEPISHKYIPNKDI